MKTIITLLVTVAGLSAGARGQLIKCLVSTDGSNFSSDVTAAPGQTVQVLITASYTGTSTAVAGFGSANFQPTIRGWRADDTLLPIRQGDNWTPAGGGVVQPYFYNGTTAGDGPHVSAGYVPGTYGRVYPMARTTLAGSSALQGFVHNNPDGTGQNYLRIAQTSNPAWIGQAGNTTGTGGVDASQIYVAGRTSSDPDFWGNREVTFDPDGGGWDGGIRIAALDVRRTNVELFRFAFTLGTGSLTNRTIDVPLAGQQIDANGHPYIGYFSDPNSASANLQLQSVVQLGFVHSLLPAPASFGALALAGLFAARRRRPH